MAIDVADHGQAELATAPDLPTLRTELSRYGDCPPDGCFDGVTAPASTLLVAFSPADTICAKVKNIDARLVPPDQVRITTALRACSVRPGGSDLPTGEEHLLAIPLTQLPASGRLTVSVRSRGDHTYGTADASTTIMLSRSRQHP